MSDQSESPSAGVTVALLIAAAVAETALLGVDSGLQRLQVGGSQSYGMTDLVGLGSGGPAVHARTAIATWKAASPGGAQAYQHWATAYLLIDLALVGFYVSALWRIAKRVGIATWWLAIVAVAELCENVARFVLVHADPNQWDGIDDVAAWAGTLAWSVRWFALGSGVLVIALRWLQHQHGGTASPLEQVRMAAAKHRGPWAPLRASLGVVVLVGALLVLPLTDQVPDIVRRWLDRGADERLYAVLAMVTVVGLAAAIWLAGQRVNYLPRRPRRRPLAPVAMVALAAALFVVAALLGWGRLRGLAIVVVAVALLSWVCGVAPGQREQIPEGWTRDTPDPDAVRRRVRWLSAAVLTIVGLGCVRAFTPPVFLLSRHVEGSAWSWDVVGLVFGGLLAVGGAIGWHSLLVWLDTRQDPRLEERSDPNPIAGRTLLLVALVVAVVCGAGSDALARAITAVGVLMVGLTVLTLASAEMVRVVESGMPSAPFRAIGLTRTPAVALIAVWLVAASAIDHGGFHDVRVTGTAQRDEPAQPSRTLEGAFTAWKSQGRCPTASVRRPLRPLLLVGASGGGIRAAYWTRTLLGDLTRGTCPRAALFAASGVSGGSLGLVSAQPAGGDDPLAADHVAPTFANMLFVDTPRSLLGFDATDRATRMELSWEHADPSLAKSFTSFPAFPLLFLNGSSVTDGCRFTVGPVEIGAEPPAPIHKQATVAPDCRGLTQYGRGVSAAGGTVDLSDFLCDGQDVRRSTAALLSARFPYISPSGRVTECAHPGRQDARVEYVVDGGYVDRTGAATMLDVWRAIEPLAASDACLAPVYVQLENGYVKVASAPGGARPGELTVPLRAIVQAYQNDTYALGAEARIAFGQSSYHQFAPTSRPGVEAPLGWVLSGSAQRDLDDQRAHVESRPEWRTLRDLLEGRLPCKPR